MRNLLAVTLLSLPFFLSNCKKSDSATTAKPITPPVTTSPYFFKFSYHDSSFNFTADFPQYMPFYPNEAGGYQVANATVFPSAGLRLSWPADDTVKESDLMGLIGKTIHFNDTLPHPEISYDAAASAIEWLSADTSNTTYNVKITNVVYLKKDTTLGYAVRTYVITGTCSAVMTDYTSFSVLSGGSFSFIISRQDH